MKFLALLLALLAVTSLGVPSDAVPDPIAVVINEVLSDPDAGADEWVELFNAGRDVDLEGFELTDQDGHPYVFPSYLLQAEGYLVLLVRGIEEGIGEVANLSMGFSQTILNNAGDDLLLTAHGRPLDFVSYGRGAGVDPPPPNASWNGSAPRAPKGRSLALQPNGLVDAGPENWKASLPTPGDVNGGTPSTGILLTEVFYHAHRDTEYVAVVNQGPAPADISYWSLADGEGMWTLGGLPLLPPEGTFRIAQNATALFEDAGLLADACVVGCAHLVERQGSLTLANEGDEVHLSDAYGRQVDAFHYGTESRGPGWEGEGAAPLPRGYLAKRLRGDTNGFQDTDSRADWTWPRMFRLGQTSRTVQAFPSIRAAPLLSPDESLSRLLSLLNASTDYVTLAGFTLTNAHIAAALHAALERGVTVHVGVESRPPGGLEDEGRNILSSLQEQGARVFLMGPSEESGFRRFAFHHAKYVVVDHRWLILGSENFSHNGYPANGTGNRGWGILLESSRASAWFQELFSQDFDPQRSDVQALVPGPASTTRVPVPSSGGDGLPDFQRVDAEVLLSPDNAVSQDGLLRILGEAESSLEVALFYVRWDWNGFDNLLLEGLLGAAERGVRVRLLLDGSAYNVRGNVDNDEVARWLNVWAREGGWNLEARLFPPGGAFIKLHNKGLIVDREAVLVSSINWNYHGAFENREAGLYLRSSALAASFLPTFEGDWSQGGSPSPVIQGPRTLRVGQVGTFRVQPNPLGAREIAWDLGADSEVDGTGETFTFRPRSPGTYPLRVEVHDGLGGRYGAEVQVVVVSGDLPLPGGNALLGLLALATGVGALLWFKVLRTTRQPTNNDRQIERREDGDPDLRRGD